MMTPTEWSVVAFVVIASMVAGMGVVRLSSRHGAVSYFTSDRNLPWWAIAISNTSTYQSGNGAFVMLMLIFGLAGNWTWWAMWIIWMPLVAVIWAPMWRRMRIITTAELITLRYGGRPATAARKMYALVCCFGFSVLLIGYITGFFAKTIAPIVAMKEWQILLIFGGTTALYTMFGGLMGVVVTEVLHFAILLAGSTVFVAIAVAQHGGLTHILERIAAIRPEALREVPPIHAASPNNSIDWITIGFLVLQGFFLAGSPTAGEGSTAQRFMAARNEGHAIGGQLFNCFLALSLRILPLIGIGLVALTFLWPESLPHAPRGVRILTGDQYAGAWAEVIKTCRLPVGLLGLLISIEVAAYTSALSALLNWGGSFIINDIYRPLDPRASVKREIWVSRLTTLILFIASGLVAYYFVEEMKSWFFYINLAMVMFFLPLSVFRFLWWRFNVWGEMAAILLGLPLSILVWFVLDFQNAAKYPLWQGLGILFGLSFIILTAVTLLTPAESPETLRKFYERCRPPGFWGPVRGLAGTPTAGIPSFGFLAGNCLLGILVCLGLVLATNAVWVADWKTLSAGSALIALCGAWLIRRVVVFSRVESALQVAPEKNGSVSPQPVPFLPGSGQEPMM
jgi:solute:Na+ symporter, SSS family